MKIIMMMKMMFMIRCTQTVIFFSHHKVMVLNKKKTKKIRLFRNLFLIFKIFSIQDESYGKHYIYFFFFRTLDYYWVGDATNTINWFPFLRILSFLWAKYATNLKIKYIKTIHFQLILEKCENFVFILVVKCYCSKSNQAQTTR